jgi:hypothetical protein
VNAGLVKVEMVKVEMLEVGMLEVGMVKVGMPVEEKSRPHHSANEWGNEQRTVVRKSVNRRIGRICRNGRIILRRRGGWISR